MNIVIVAIEDSRDGKRVRFRTPIGIGLGVWEGDLPIQGSSVDVELEIDDDLHWGDNIAATNLDSSMISSENHLFRFVARVISYEDDECLVVKLGESVVMLNVENAPTDVGGWVQGCAERVRLYPINL